ncbi:MAG: NAD(P)H-dependent glycerol-3-phosphate dehydrogenase [Thermodesulfobacteriota bacterium]
MRPVEITVLGAGSWGTTLANLLALKGHKVRLWAREAEVVESIRARSVNEVFLPGIELSPKLSPEASITEAVTNAGLIVSVVPSHGLRGVFEQIKDVLPDGPRIVSASKGVEQGSLLTPSAIIKDVLQRDCTITVLSGPSFAVEVATGLPAAVSAAGERVEEARFVQEVFSTPAFRVYVGTDVLGVELGGALKNVIAIAAGISDGLELGFNARAALITRGLAEISRLGAVLGAKERTFAGLSGLGDLVLTCTGPLSRNYTVGVELGRGKTIDEIVSSMHMVAEGVKTSRAVLALAASKGVDMPIAETVSAVIKGEKTSKEGVAWLMTRELTEE